MKLLAIETSTEMMSLAVQSDARLWVHEGMGGAQSSGTLMDAVLALMQEAELGFAELDAIVWGCGPGSFTGVRTACAVAQGLGFAHGTPLLGINTLAACAQMAALDRPDHAGPVVVALDARMGEIYVAHYQTQGWVTQSSGSFQVMKPQDLTLTHDVLLCGNASEHHPGLVAQTAIAPVVCVPNATLLLALAPVMLAQGQAVCAAQAAPLYVRDKVARTTAERHKSKA
jgi:tRNA threonylcarbamoyladenosine biosynthesis protein TsaB